MARAISNRLAKRITNGGEYSRLLDYINSKSELALEVRIEGRIIIYYQKSKILTLFPVREPELLSVGYYVGKAKPSLNLQYPEIYFEYAMKLVDNHSKPSEEFYIQQKILRDNGDLDNSYLVIDMEYQFAQKNIKDRTSNNTRFDLVAIDLNSYKIVLFELKQGLGAIDGGSGVDWHFSKYNEHGIRSDFRNALLTDVKHILEAKHLLKVFKFDIYKVLKQVEEVSDIEYKMVFAYNCIAERDKFQKENEICPTLYIDKTCPKYLLQ